MKNEHSLKIFTKSSYGLIEDCNTHIQMYDNERVYKEVAYDFTKDVEFNFNDIFQIMEGTLGKIENIKIEGKILTIKFNDITFDKGKIKLGLEDLIDMYNVRYKIVKIEKESLILEQCERC